MRRILLVFVTGLLFGSPSHAQLGARVGAALANTSSDIQFTDANGQPIGTGTGYFVSYTYGLSLGLPLSEQLFIQPEINYLQKGFELPEITTSTEQVSALRLGIAYLELPVLLRREFPAGSGRLYLQGGPAVGYALQVIERIREENTWNTRRFPVSDFYGGGYRRWELSGVVGGGWYSAPIGQLRLVVDGRYIHGLTNNLDNLAVERHRNVALTAGVVYDW